MDIVEELLFIKQSEQMTITLTGKRIHIKIKNSFFVDSLT